MALTFLGDLLNSTIGRGFNAAWNNLENNWNAARDYKYQIQGLHESPSALAQGFRDAGFSPALIGGMSGMAGQTNSNTVGGSAIGTGVRQLEESAFSRRQQRELEKEALAIDREQQASWSQYLSARAREATASARMAEHDANLYDNSVFPRGTSIFGSHPVGLDSAIGAFANGGLQNLGQSLWTLVPQVSGLITSPTKIVGNYLLNQFGLGLQAIKSGVKKISDAVSSRAQSRLNEIEDKKKAAAAARSRYKENNAKAYRRGMMFSDPEER